MDRGWVSAARITSSEVPRDSDLVASFCEDNTAVSESSNMNAIGDVTYSALLELAVVRALLDHVKQLLGETSVGKRPSGRLLIGHFDRFEVVKRIGCR